MYSLSWNELIVYVDLSEFYETFANMFMYMYVIIINAS